MENFWQIISNWKSLLKEKCCFLNYRLFPSLARASLTLHAKQVLWHQINFAFSGQNVSCMITTEKPLYCYNQIFSITVWTAFSSSKGGSFLSNWSICSLPRSHLLLSSRSDVAVLLSWLQSGCASLHQPSIQPALSLKLFFSLYALFFFTQQHHEGG